MAQAIHATLRPRIVLVVDTDPDTRQMLRVWLEMCGFGVLEAATGAEALDIAAESPPDLISTEMWLPGVDGYELCRRLRDNLGTRLTPIVAFTTRSMPKEVERAFQAGCNVVIVKPCTPAHLEDAINRLLLVTPCPLQRRQASEVHLQSAGTIGCPA